MNPVTCHCDSVAKGNISITETASFSSSVDFITSSDNNNDHSSSWTCEIQNVVQLQVGKKAPFTAARISFKKDNESICKTLNFSSAQDRTVFVSVVERIKKEQDEMREKQKLLTSSSSSNVKKEDDASRLNNNDDDDDEVNIISIRRKAWLDNDNMSSRVFQLLSEVSAFGNSNNNSSHKKKSAVEKNHQQKSKKTKEESDSCSSDDDGNDNFDLSSSSASSDLFESILREEEQKYFIHPDRQEMASASVYDALNSLVDPATKTLLPVSQAIAAGVFKQIPHLAAVYSRVVHSAEEEMLFWVSVVRRRLFFSRTKLDSELAECGNILCPLTTTSSSKDSFVTKNKVGDDRNGDEDDQLLIDELDLQEQRPKHDQVREIQKVSSSAIASATKNNNNHLDKKNSVAALVSELNFASGKCVDDLSALMFEGRTNRNNDNNNNDDKARLLQFGAMGFAEKQEAEKILQKEKNSNEERSAHEDSRRRQRNGEDVTETNQKKVDYSLAVSLAKKLSVLQQETKITSASRDEDDNWEVVFVGKTPFQALREVEEHNSQLLRQVANNNSVLQSQSKGNNNNNADVKPLHHHHHSNEYSSSLLRQVGSNSSSVHGRAAAFLVKIFWRKAKETFDLIAEKNRHQESSMTTVVKKFQKKVDASVSRLRGIRQSLQNVLDQWNVGEGERSSNGNTAGEMHLLDKKEKKQWMDALKQIENVISLLQ